MKTKVKQININEYMHDCMNLIDEYNTHFNNHMSDGYKDVIRKGIIIIQLALVFTILFI